MRQKSILVVDDDPDLCGMIAKMLKRLEVTVACAHTLQEAKEKLGEVHPVLVFLDHNLPDGKGLNILNNIKEYNNCKVIMMSGDHTPQLRTIALNRGADEFMEKPLRTDIINKVVVAAIRK